MMTTREADTFNQCLNRADFMTLMHKHMCICVCVTHTIHMQVCILTYIASG